MKSETRTQGSCLLQATSTCSLLPLGIFLLLHAQAAYATSKTELGWNDAIHSVPLPTSGCFAASYPDLTWRAVRCQPVTKPLLSGPPISVGNSRPPKAGGGNDYTANTSTPISSAIGAFPCTSGIKREVGYKNTPNIFSLQVNSNNDIKSALCGQNNSCTAWQQFVYSTRAAQVFMQYWLLGYGKTRPLNWSQSGINCYMNSSGVGVPAQVITSLSDLVLSGTAAAGGNDEVELTTGTQAYAVSNSDSVLSLSGSWLQAEFNVFGDGGGSSARFNKGSAVSVDLKLQDGSNSAPTCKGNSGTTGETNNLVLGPCSAGGGSSPSISFSESLDPIGPSIAGITPVTASGTQTITLSGSGFGTHPPYDGDSRFIWIADVSGKWNAGWTGNNPKDLVTLSIQSWADSAIVLNGFTGDYGQNGWTLQNGQTLQFHAWNAQTHKGPAACSLLVGGAGIGGGGSQN